MQGIKKKVYLEINRLEIDKFHNKFGVIKALRFSLGWPKHKNWVYSCFNRQLHKEGNC
ncbi:unnamed protein product [Moneuplotes crassus]|uniref:Uncharacterized protein n=1 Tax=Euplotes crassus TaxID=5936 RepID=A0AAD2D7H3_EUPCR|nr:unnamed protein product [Moneuplotes crassus]